MNCPHKRTHALHLVCLLVIVILMCGNLYRMLR